MLFVNCLLLSENMFSRIKAIILEHLYRLFRSPDEWIDTFFWPIMDVIIWGFTTLYFNRLGGTSAKIASFLLGGMILWTIVWRAQQDISVTLMADIWNQNLINLFSSPITSWEYILATIILGFIKIFLTLSVIITLSFFLYTFNIFILGFYLVPMFIILLLFSWALGIFINGLIIRFGRRVQFIAWSLVVLLHPVSCVYYPLSSLPKFLQQISVFIPGTYVFEAMREVLRNQVPTSEFFIYGFLIVLVWLVITSISFNILYEASRQKGRLAKIEE